MIIKSAIYEISCSKVEQCPAHDMPEYAFIGRSNVGKSSLINMLTGYGKLAKTSSMPGKTLLINHFLINKNWYIVDLPGYGYAKRSKKVQDELETMISSYILRRKQMTNLFVLIDSRHEPQRIDMEFLQWLGEHQIPFAIVFTKGDKLSASQVKRNVSQFLKHLSKEWEELPPYFITSSETKMGREEVLNYIQEINDTL